MEEVGGAASNSESSDSEDGSTSQRQEMTEERRAKLREIEVTRLSSVCDCNTSKCSPNVGSWAFPVPWPVLMKSTAKLGSVCV